MPGAEIAIHLAQMLFRRLDRKYIETLRSTYCEAELETKYGKPPTGRVLTAVFKVMLFISVNFVLMYGAYELIEQYARRDPDLQIIFRESTVSIVAALALGFVSACGLLMFVELIRQRLVYRGSLHEYMAYKCLQFEFDVYRRATQVIIFAGTPLLLLAVLCADTYTVVTTREIVLNPFLGFGETRYGFAQVAALQERTFIGPRKQRQEMQTYHSIEFKDGVEWKSIMSKSSVSSDEFRQGKRVVVYVSLQTGLPIIQAPMDP